MFCPVHSFEQVKGTDITCTGEGHCMCEAARNVQKTDITSERNRGQKLHRRNVRGHIAVCKIETTLLDITSNCLLSSSQDPSKCLF